MVRWASLLTFANAWPWLGDRRSCVRDLKTTTAWWGSCGSYTACSGLRRLVLHGSDWLAWGIVGNDGACGEGYLSALLLVCGGAAWGTDWSGVELVCLY